MSNSYYNASGAPSQGSSGSSATMRGEFNAIVAGFDKLPTLGANGGRVVIINPGSTGMTSSSVLEVSGSTVTVTGDLAVTGALSLTNLTLSGNLTVQGNTALGNAGADTLTIASSAVTWSGNPTHSGAHTFSSPVLVPAGAVALPGLAFAGDTNNGWWSPAADIQAWSIAGAELMRLNATGLGIGVTPVTPLHVKSALVVPVRVETTTARGSGQVTIGLYDPTGVKGYFGYGAANDALHVYNGLAQPVVVYTNAAEALRVASGGTITQNATAVGIAGNANTALTIAMGTGAYISSKGSGGQEMIAGADTSGVVVGSYSNHQLALRTNNTDRVTVDASGNVGIGTTPSNPLHLNAVSGGTLIRLSDTTPRTLGFLGSGSGIISTAAAADLGLRAETNLVFASNGNNERMRIDTSGRLLINRTTDSGLGLLQMNISSGSDVADFASSGAARLNLRAAAGSIAAVRIAGNGATAGTASLDLQQDSAGAVDIVQRANARLSIYTNATEYFRISSAGVITEQPSGAELGYKGLPSASVTTGAFVAADRGKCVYATGGVTVPNSTMAAGDVVIIQNTTGSSITITASVATMRQTGTANTGNRTLLQYGRCAVVFGSGTLAYISGDIT